MNNMTVKNLTKDLHMMKILHFNKIGIKIYFQRKTFHNAAFKKTHLFKIQITIYCQIMIIDRLLNKIK